MPILLVYNINIITLVLPFSCYSNNTECPINADDKAAVSCLKIVLRVVDEYGKLSQELYTQHNIV